jgi:hypothetical protein
MSILMLISFFESISKAKNIDESNLVQEIYTVIKTSRQGSVSKIHNGLNELCKNNWNYFSV